MMVQFAPYVLAVSGGMLLVSAATVRVNGAWPFFTHKLVAPAVGAIAIWMSALMLVGGA